MKSLIVFLSFYLCTTCILAQTKDVTGTVTNDKNEPVTGAIIKVKGDAQSSNTDDNGMFSLKSIPDTAILVISAAGYEETEINTVDKFNMEIKLVRTNLFARSSVKLQRIFKAAVQNVLNNS